MSTVTFPLCAQCYLFHMYVGVRAGGGIGDEIEDPAGDPYELYRILFDITFFFFVIVILLAIIQGELQRCNLRKIECKLIKVPVLQMIDCTDITVCVFPLWCQV